MPVDLTFTAQNATLVTNDMLTERLDANLTVAGEAQANLTVQGTVRVRRADLQIPDKLPQSVAVLPVRNPNAPPQPAAKPAPAPNIALNITIKVDQFLIRGHGAGCGAGGGDAGPRHRGQSPAERRPQGAARHLRRARPR